MSKRDLIDASGGLVVWKPRGITTRRAADIAESLLGYGPLGHTGTLDPLASGICILLGGIGRKFQSVLMSLPKRYHAQIYFGVGSYAHDLESGVYCPVPRRCAPDEATVRAALERFHGKILQRPPEISAVRIAGQRSYKLARRGVPLEPAARTVEVFALRLLEYRPPIAEVELDCSAGFYVRSLARDLGEMCGCTAALSALRRTAAGRYAEADAVPLDLSTRADWLPLEVLLSRLERLEIPSEMAHGLSSGQPAAWRDRTEGRFVLWQGARVAGWGEIEDGLLHPRRWLPAPATRR